MPVPTIDPPIREAVLRLMRGGYTLRESTRALGLTTARTKATRAAHPEWAAQIAAIEGEQPARSGDGVLRRAGVLPAISLRLVGLSSRSRRRRCDVAAWD